MKDVKQLDETRNGVPNNLMASDELKLKREVQLKLANEVERLLHHDGQEELRWRGSRADLMEALYLVYDTGELKDDYGQLVNYSQLVRRVCQLLHLRVPSNPHKVATLACCRKGVRQMTYMDRCFFMMKAHSDQLLWNEIENYEL